MATVDAQVRHKAREETDMTRETGLQRWTRITRELQEAGVRVRKMSSVQVEDLEPDTKTLAPPVSVRKYLEIVGPVGNDGQGSVPFNVTFLPWEARKGDRY